MQVSNTPLPTLFWPVILHIVSMLPQCICTSFRALHPSCWQGDAWLEHFVGVMSHSYDGATLSCVYVPARMCLLGPAQSLL
jgi:hypothetical protein